MESISECQKPAFVLRKGSGNEAFPLSIYFHPFLYSYIGLSALCSFRMFQLLHCFPELPCKEYCCCRYRDGIRDGFRKEHRHILLFHKMRQNINQWYQQQYFTVNCQKQRGFCVADGDKGLLAGNLYPQTVIRLESK